MATRSPVYLEISTDRVDKRWEAVVLVAGEPVARFRHRSEDVAYQRALAHVRIMFAKPDEPALVS